MKEVVAASPVVVGADVQPGSCRANYFVLVQKRCTLYHWLVSKAARRFSGLIEGLGPLRMW